MDNYMQEEMAQAMEPAEDAGEVSAKELGAGLAEEAHTRLEEESLDEREAAMQAVRAGIGELFEDGWTAQELTAFSQSPIAREAIAGGKSVARAACAYLRAQQAAPRKSGVPTARTIATGGYDQGNPIEHMTDAEFDAFSRRAREAAMAGRKVRI